MGRKNQQEKYGLDGSFVFFVPLVFFLFFSQVVFWQQEWPEYKQLQGSGIATTAKVTDRYTDIVVISHEYEKFYYLTIVFQPVEIGITSDHEVNIEVSYDRYEKTAVSSIIPIVYSPYDITLVHLSEQPIFPITFWYSVVSLLGIFIIIVRCWRSYKRYKALQGNTERSSQVSERR